MPNPTPTGATCTGGFADLTDVVLAANVNGISLTPTQAAALRFDPAAGFTGLAAFKYSAVDNTGLISINSAYTIPVSGAGNIPPLAKNIVTTPMPDTNGPTAIPALFGSDADGTIATFTLYSVPSTTQGVLSIPCPATPPGATCTGGFADLTPAVLAANVAGIVLTPAQAAAMRFDPDPNFSGKVEFSYTTTDNTSASSAGAVYTIPVTSILPVANTVVAPSMPQTNGPTTIPGLIATDADGTIASYSIESLPPVSQGVLSIPCPPTLIGATCTGGFQNLTSTILANYPTGGIPLTPAQMAAMRFDPAGGYSGDVVFNYHATDNSGLISNSATYIIPVSGLPPISANVLAPKMLNSNGPTAIPALNSTDADGTISNYVIISVPPISQGVLSIPCPPTPTGATCTGGFADLTAAVLTANPGGISLTAIQIAGLRFDPDPSFNGNVTFNYAAYDNNGNLSNVAGYKIPTGTAIILPLSLTSFSGERIGSNILLKWTTENEINVNHFDIEYSTDGINFINAGLVKANNLAVNNYQFTLNNFIEPIYYLRLKSIDVDGRFKYSAVAVVRMNNKLTKTVAVTPNLVTGIVQVKITSDVNANADVQVMTAIGQVIYQAKQQVFKGDNILPLQNLSAKLSKGTYLVKVLLDGKILTTKFVFLK